MHTHLKLNISKELSQHRRKLQKVVEQLELHPATNQQEEDLLLNQQLHSEKDRIEERIQELEKRLNSLDNEIVLGPIHVEFDDATKKKFYIVKEALVNPRQGLISMNSPLASILSETTPGETVSWETPGGLKSAKVVATA